MGNIGSNRRRASSPRGGSPRGGSSRASPRGDSSRESPASSSSPHDSPQSATSPRDRPSPPSLPHGGSTASTTASTSSPSSPQVPLSSSALDAESLTSGASDHDLRSGAHEDRDDGVGLRGDANGDGMSSSSSSCSDSSAGTSPSAGSPESSSNGSPTLHRPLQPPSPTVDPPSLATAGLRPVRVSGGPRAAAAAAAARVVRGKGPLRTPLNASAGVAAIPSSSVSGSTSPRTSDTPLSSSHTGCHGPSLYAEEDVVQQAARLLSPPLPTTPHSNPDAPEPASAAPTNVRSSFELRRAAANLKRFDALVGRFYPHMKAPSQQQQQQPQHTLATNADDALDAPPPATRPSPKEITGGSHRVKATRVSEASPPADLDHSVWTLDSSALLKQRVSPRKRQTAAEAAAEVAAAASHASHRRGGMLMKDAFVMDPSHRHSNSEDSNDDDDDADDVAAAAARLLRRLSQGPTGLTAVPTWSVTAAAATAGQGDGATTFQERVMTRLRTKSGPLRAPPPPKSSSGIPNPGVYAGRSHFSNRELFYLWGLFHHEFGSKLSWNRLLELDPWAARHPDLFRAVFATVDKDCDGWLSFEEFFFGASTILRGGIEEKLQLVFELLTPPESRNTIHCDEAVEMAVVADTVLADRSGVLSAAIDDWGVITPSAVDIRAMFDQNESTGMDMVRFVALSMSSVHIAKWLQFWETFYWPIGKLMTAHLRISSLTLSLDHTYRSLDMRAPPALSAIISALRVRLPKECRLWRALREPAWSLKFDKHLVEALLVALGYHTVDLLEVGPQHLLYLLRRYLEGLPVPLFTFAFSERLMDFAEDPELLATHLKWLHSLVKGSSNAAVHMSQLFGPIVVRSRSRAENVLKRRHAITVLFFAIRRFDELFDTKDHTPVAPDVLHRFLRGLRQATYFPLVTDDSDTDDASSSRSSHTFTSDEDLSSLTA